jgi:hypothetical protein
MTGPNVGSIEALGDDALQSHGAGALENGLTVSRHVIVEPKER